MPLRARGFTERRCSSFPALLCCWRFGIYAVISYSVTERTHEMGVRLSLGTTPTRLRMKFMGHGLATVIFGTLGGVIGAAITGKLLGSLIEGAEAFNVPTYVLAVISICVVAAASIWFATRRVAKICRASCDVVEILRAE